MMTQVTIRSFSRLLNNPPTSLDLGWRFRPLLRRLVIESLIVALLAFGADLATTLYGLSVGLHEENPLSGLMGFPAFIMLSLFIQLTATIAVSSTWNAFNGHWRAGYILCCSPRFLIALLNLQKAFFPSA